ncbi:hypothetical protein PTSG_12085 [Salpingoeca rosetta]|uniref:PX domain-containing protein n=1 Tax=Salpingoeca rosetta (strain ATCC 50818 / BSB-021) TaxID=946362 RepID=F2U5H6_SALR5|nr:uncharacterized protein PTSG_12085 [Salpingoeca rosetta]EGD83192.1 hypothetical protein PTSG_12085 [Salpingoeca rosetta]|eukprot:XP_004995556.1 hypothetical protein PTSG_12085 [Salpingoeca rosetta]
MHISVGGVEELTEVKPKRNVTERYVSYKIHINGTYHCSARYSQLAQLHEKLKREFGAGCLDKFPPKNFFYLKPDECHDRRFMLQKWLQKIAQQPRIVKGNTFQTFLLNAQKEVQKAEESWVQLEVYLVNGKKVSVDIMNIDQTDDVLETVRASRVHAFKCCSHCAGTPCYQNTTTSDITPTHTQNTHTHIRTPPPPPHTHTHTHVATILSHACAPRLRGLQTIAEMKNGHINPTDEDAEKLQDLRAQRDRKAFIELARKQPGYGYAFFGEVKCNWPENDSMVTVSLGSVPPAPACMRLHDKVSGEDRDFLVRRMRCWRTYSTEDGVELEFEYLVSTDDNGDMKMKWIKLVSEATIHLAMCLQFLVEEMLRINKGDSIRTPKDREGIFKPRRQTNAPPDLSFLTSDNEPQQQEIRVVLSDLLKCVQADEEAEEEVDDFALTDTARAQVERGLDLADDTDDPTANFAAMVGLE